MNRNFKFLLCFLSIIYSCKEEPIPSYINISSITVTTNSSQGSSSSNISDAWVYNDPNLQGVYEMPVEFPILAEGNTRLILFAGIKLNGIAATRAVYPFYGADTIDVSLQPAKADTIFPTVKYSDNAVFDFVEDFENGSEFSNVMVTTEDVFEGNTSGKLMVTDSSEVVAITNASFTIPFNTPAAFFELDYKNNHVFEVGIRALLGADFYNIYKLTVAPRNDWNKLYVNFTPEIGQIQGDSYQIYLRTVAQIEPDSVKIFFDNLKLIHAKVQ